MNKEYHTKTGKRIRLIHGDCMEWMKDCDKYDLAIVDPPYGINIVEQLQKSVNHKSSMFAVKNSNKGSQQWDKSIPNKNYFDTLINISDNQIIWGGNYFLDYLNSTRCFVVWDKQNGTNSMADAELAWTSFDKSVRMFRGHIFTGIGNTNYNPIHPTQKPVRIYRWLLQNYAKEGDRIFDSHGGSMSHAIACWDEDFALDIIELDKDYYDSAVKRFEQHIKQGTLF